MMAILHVGVVTAQSLETIRTYFDPLTKTALKESWTVIAGTPTKQGLYKEYDREGNIIQQANFKNNKLNGERLRYYIDYQLSTGKLRLKQVYANDKLVEETSYKKSGRKNYHKVVKGTWTYWHDDGSVAMKATLYPGGSWDTSADVSASDFDAPKGDDFYIINSLGTLVKVKEIKFYLNGKVVGENYFATDGLSIKNIDYNTQGQKTSEWVKDQSSGLYTETLYYETGPKAVSTQFKLVRDPKAGNYQHYMVVKEGDQIRWDESGQVVNRGRYIDNRRVGPWKVYFDQDWKEVPLPSEASFYREITYSDESVPTGPVADYYANGQKQWEGYLLSENPDVFDGVNKFYYPNGQLKAEQNYLKGYLNGESKTYKESGELTILDTYDNGLSKTRIEYYLSGETMRKSSFEEVEFGVGPAGLRSARTSKLFIGNTEEFNESGELISEGKINYTLQPPGKFEDWVYYDKNGTVIKYEKYDHTGSLKETKTGEQIQTEERRQSDLNKKREAAANQKKIESDNRAFKTETSRLLRDLPILIQSIERKYLVKDEIKSAALGKNVMKARAKNIYAIVESIQKELSSNKLDQLSPEKANEIVKDRVVVLKAIDSLGSKSNSQLKSIDSKVKKEARIDKRMMLIKSIQ